MLTEEQGEEIVRYARKVLESYVRNEDLPEVPNEDFLEEEKGVFVTLNKNGELRGCVGLPFPDFPLGEAVKRAAQSAADDRRFPPLKPEGLESIEIEVTVLAEPEKVEVEEPEDYLKKIEVGKHGLLIEGQGNEGLLLPQVPVDQDWNCEEYLEGLCRKARLPSQAWRKDYTEIKSFQGQIFKQ
ncbi:MAG: TIGR00296 family protein [Candidatus Aenigmatarchaeota archaeon]